jgi:hypothetical protein
MASKKIIIDVKVNEKGVVQTNAKMSSSLDNLAKSTNNASTAQAGFNKQLDKGKTNAGLAGAIVTEFGRTISDLPYGIRGIGNNLSQLASLFGLFAANAKTSGISMKEAFGDLRRQFLGPIGILTLFQILIALLQSEKFMKFISTLGSMSEKMRLLSGLTKDVAQNASTLVGNFEIYTKTLMSANETSEQKVLALKKLNKEYPDFNASILLDKERTEEADIARKNYIDTLRQQAVSQAAIAKSQEITGDIVAAQFDTELRLSEQGFENRKAFNKAVLIAEEKLAKDLDRLSRTSVIGAPLQSKKDKDTLSLRNTINANDKIIVEENRKLDALFKLIDLEEDKRTGSSKRFKRQFLRFTQEIFQARKQIRQTLTTDRFAEIKELADLEKGRLRAERDVFIEKQKQREKDGLITNTQYKESEIQAANELQTALVAIENKTQVLITTAKLDEMQKRNELSLENGYALIKLQTEQSLESERIEGVKTAKRLEDDVLILESKLRLNIQELNDETKTALEREKIQTEITQNEQKQSSIRSRIAKAESDARLSYFDLIGNALTSFSGLAKKGSAEAKALAVAGALTSTYFSAQKAFESQFMPLALVDSPVRGAIAAAAAIASGLGNVKSILSIDANGESSAKGGSVQVAAPDFNVVGASPESQLAQTVAEQQTKPIKAFVVGKDITNQQELDRNIITTSGLGD